MHRTNAPVMAMILNHPRLKKGHALTVHQLSQSLDKNPPNSIHQATRDLHARGGLGRDNEGRYYLPTKHPAHMAVWNKNPPKMFGERGWVK